MMSRPKCLNTYVDRVWHDDPEGGPPMPFTFGAWWGFVDGVEYGNSVLITGHDISEDRVHEILRENATETGVTNPDCHRP